MKNNKKFVCYGCKKTFKTNKECKHYDNDEMDEEGEVSLCDSCNKHVMKKAKEINIQGLSRRFYNCN